MRENVFLYNDNMYRGHKLLLQLHTRFHVILSFSICFIYLIATSEGRRDVVIGCLIEFLGESEEELIKDYKVNKRNGNKHNFQYSKR